MKFRRNVTIFKGRLDAAPWACLFVILTTLLLLKSVFFRPSGIALTLPESRLSGLPNAAFRILIIDRQTRLHLDNQVVPLVNLESRLSVDAEEADEPITLVLQADQRVPVSLVNEIHQIALAAGFADVMLATRPAPAETPLAR